MNELYCNKLVSSYEGTHPKLASTSFPMYPRSCIDLDNPQYYPLCC